MSLKLLSTGPPSTPVGPLKIGSVTETSAELSWKPSEKDGGTSITSYIVEYRDAKRSFWTKSADVQPDVTHFVVGKLLTDNEYYFRVTAVNAEGQSSPLVSTDTAKPSKKLSEFYF